METSTSSTKETSKESVSSLQLKVLKMSSTVNMGVPPEELVQVYSGVDKLVTSGAPPVVGGRELMPSSFTHREVLVTWVLL